MIAVVYSVQIENESPKYVLTKNKKVFEGVTLYQIKSTRIILGRASHIRNIKKGRLGGWVESENNLSQGGCCWIEVDSIVMGNAVVKDDSRINSNSVISENSKVIGDSYVRNSIITGDSILINSRVGESKLENVQPQGNQSFIRCKIKDLCSVIINGETNWRMYEDNCSKVIISDNNKGNTFDKDLIDQNTTNFITNDAVFTVSDSEIKIMKYFLKRIV